MAHAPGNREDRTARPHPRNTDGMREGFPRQNVEHDRQSAFARRRLALLRILDQLGCSELHQSDGIRYPPNHEHGDHHSTGQLDKDRTEDSRRACKLACGTMRFAINVKRKNLGAERLL
jgi:hypothetical protein